jgi:glycosyltransferase involved in cell wall biosynthesis
LSPGRPHVSICIPLRNGAKWIDAAVDSALAQTYEDFELLAVDNCSSDGSLELVQARLGDDERIRVEVNREPLGAVGNHDRCIRLARGELIKFLHQDDLLKPDCLARMVRPFEAHPRVGLAFCRREVLLEEPGDPGAVAWKASYAELHTGFSSLGKVNRGGDLLADYLPEFGDTRYRNWIGEPSAVMVRRSAIQQVGDFNDRMWQSWDLELWLRLMAHYDVSFLDERLVVFRHHAASLTAANEKRRAEWLDLVWLYEGLLAEPALEEHHAMIRRFRRRGLLGVARRQLLRLWNGNLDLRPLGSYLAHRLRALAGGRPALPYGKSQA